MKELCGSSLAADQSPFGLALNRNASRSVPLPANSTLNKFLRLTTRSALRFSYLVALAQASPRRRGAARTAWLAILPFRHALRGARLPVWDDFGRRTMMELGRKCGTLEKHADAPRVLLPRRHSLKACLRIICLFFDLVKTAIRLNPSREGWHADAWFL
jgi:hypothetical protein